MSTEPLTTNPRDNAVVGSDWGLLVVMLLMVLFGVATMLVLSA